MGCTASTTKVAEHKFPVAEKDKWKLNKNSRDLVIDQNGRSSPSNSEKRFALTTIDMNQVNTERKESSLPEVDKDLKMDQHPEDQEEEDADSFDAAPLSREKIASRNTDHPMKKTMDFIYNNPSSPSQLGSGFPKFQAASPRYANRRASGVPPPPRPLNNSDTLFKFSEGKKGDALAFKEDEETEEEDNIPLKER